MKNKVKLIVALAIILTTSQNIIAQYEGEVNGSPSEIELEQTDGWDIATIPGCSMETSKGKPYLPVKHLHIAIPSDKTVSGIEILNTQQQELSGTYNIMPTQPHYIAGEPEPPFLDPDSTIYNTDSFYPETQINHKTTGFMSGVHIAGINYYPLTYNPVTQKLLLTTHISYRLIFSDEENNPVKPRRMSMDSYLTLKEEIKRYTENPDDVEVYFQLDRIDPNSNRGFTPDDFPNFHFHGQSPEYVIITNEALANGFQEIADWKTRKGIPAVVRTVEWIYGYYQGVDNADMVRNFIIDAVENWGVQYIMLGGDSEIIPIRLAWISHWNAITVEPSFPDGIMIPTDMYFSCLDRNWNADGDATYGEGNWNRQNDGAFEREYPDEINLDDVDPIPEVCVGRIPVENIEELDRYKAKLFKYEKESFGNENNILFYADNPDGIKHAREAFPPGLITSRGVYESAGHTNLDVLTEFNGTNQQNPRLHHIICGLGHGGPHSFEATNGSLNRTHMDGLENEEDPRIIFFLNSCTTMPWNKNTVTEHFINAENGGVAVMGATELSWISQVGKYNAPMITEIYTENQIFGKSFNAVKIRGENYTLKDSWDRNMFFAVNIDADPAMHVWTDVPDDENPLTAYYPSEVYVGEQTIEVEIENLITDVEAKVCLFKEDEIYAIDSEKGTGDNITLSLECTPDTYIPNDKIYVTVTAKNHKPVEGTITVIQNPGIHLFAIETVINDYSGGNGNEIIDAGETVEMDVILMNTGGAIAENVIATISTEAENIRIDDNQSGYGDIGAGEVGQPDVPYIINFSKVLPDGFYAIFSLNITDDQSNVYHDTLFILIHGPEPQLLSSVIFTTQGDPENPEIIDWNDHVKLTIEIYNDGTGMATDLMGELSSGPGYVENIDPAIQSFGDILPHSSESNLLPFEFDVVGYNYLEDEIVMTLTITDDFGKVWTIDFNIYPLGIVSNLGFTNTNESISLYWDPPDPVTSVRGYNIYRSDSPDGPYDYRVNDNEIRGFSGYTNAGLTPLSEFYYKVKCVSHSGIEGGFSDPELLAWTTLPYHPDWPLKKINSDSYGHKTMGSPIVADFDANGTKEIYLTSTNNEGDESAKGGIFGFYHYCTEIFDIENNPTFFSGFYNFDIAGSRATPAIGDLDNDGILEIITTTQGYNTNDDRRKLIIHSSIDLDEEYGPDFIDSKTIGNNYKGAVLADIDYDNDLEIIAMGIDAGYIYVFDYDSENEELKPFGEELGYLWPIQINGTGYGMPVVANLDNLGDKELIFGFNGGENFDAGIYVFKSDGNPYLEENTDGLFYKNGPSQDVYDRMDSPPTVVDINNDGHPEIICVSGRYNSGTPEARVFILDHNGIPIDGWEYEDEDENHTFSITELESTNDLWLPVTSVGNVDGINGIEVIVAGNEYIYVWKQNGDPFIDPIFVEGLQAKFIAPLIADIDEDDDLEIIVASNGSEGLIHAYDYNGEKVFGWPVKVDRLQATPCIDDIDNDGKNELIASGGNEIFVWDTEGDANKIEWGKYRHDSYNSGTYGDVCTFINDPVLISGNVEWTLNYLMQRDIIIESEGVLTIHGNVAMPENARITIHPGGQLTIDGGLVTSACQGPWSGIHVLGNPTLEQVPISNHGIVRVVNEGTIRNASCGIMVSGGAIVIADSANFINNITAVEFEQYQYESISNFTFCKFETNEECLSEFIPAHFVGLSEINGVIFKGCSFSNIWTNYNEDITQRGIGIYSKGSGFNLNYICKNLVVPCDDYQNNTFEGLFYGIYSVNLTHNYPVRISHTNFTNNLKGLYLSGHQSGIEITSNNFDLYNQQISYDSYGLYLDYCSGYHIEDNNFYNESAVPDIPGLYIYNSGTEDNMIYNNSFNNLYYALIAQNINRNGIQGGGLCIKCNDFYENYYDISVTVMSPYGSIHHGIAEYQGSMDDSDDAPAGNIFSDHGEDEWDIYNEGNNINYIHHLESSTTLKVRPDEDKISYNVHLQENPNANYNKLISCPSTLNPGNGDPKGLKSQVASADSAIVTVQTELATFVDGGDTEEMNFDVVTSVPDEALEVTEQLLDESPYLSDTVMKSAIDKEDVLPNAMIRDILVANPQSAKSDDILDALDERWDPMPDYMMADIMEGLDSIGAKEILDARLSYYKQESAKARYSILRLYMNDTANLWANDSLISLLEDDPVLQSKYRLAFVHQHAGDSIEANAVLDSISINYDLTESQQDNHSDYLTLFGVIQQLQNDSLLFIPIDSIHISTLETLASNNMYLPGVYSRNILLANGLSDWEEPVVLPDPLKSMETRKDYSKARYSVVKRSFLRVYPNPTKHYFIAEYHLEKEYNDMYLEILDVTANMVGEVNIEGKQNQAVIPVKDLKPGIYFIRLIAGGTIMDTQKITVL